MRISDWSSDVCSSDLLRCTIVTGICRRIVRMSYIIRLEGIGSTSVCASSLQEALKHEERFQKMGKKNIVLGQPGSNGVPLNEVRKRCPSYGQNTVIACDVDVPNGTTTDQPDSDGYHDGELSPQ